MPRREPDVSNAAPPSAGIVAPLPAVRAIEAAPVRPPAQTPAQTPVQTPAQTPMRLEDSMNSMRPTCFSISSTWGRSWLKE